MWVTAIILLPLGLLMLAFAMSFVFDAIDWIADKRFSHQCKKDKRLRQRKQAERIKELESDVYSPLWMSLLSDDREVWREHEKKFGNQVPADLRGVRMEGEGAPVDHTGTKRRKVAPARHRPQGL